MKPRLTQRAIVWRTYAGLLAVAIASAAFLTGCGGGGAEADEAEEAQEARQREQLPPSWKAPVAHEEALQ